MRVLTLMVLVGSLICSQPVMVEALDTVARVVHHDNEYQLNKIAPTRLVMPEVLWALGISNSEEQVPFVLETMDGKQHQVTLYPVAENQIVEWVSAADKSAKKPLYQKNSDSNFWFEEIEGEHAVYWQFNEVYDTVKESIATFATHLKNYLRWSIEKEKAWHWQPSRG